MKQILQRRLLLYGSILLLVTSLCFTYFSYHQLTNSTYTELKQIAQIVSTKELNLDLSNNLRITLIDPKGIVLYDNRSDSATMPNHLNRPEIQTALQNGEGYAKRNSETMNTAVFYYALLLENGNVLRISKNVHTITAQFIELLPFFFLLFVILWIGVYLLSKYFAKAFVKPIQNMLNDPTHYDSFYDDFIPMIREYRKSRDDLLQNNLRIEAEQQKLVQLIENMSEGFLLLDSNKNIDLVNYAFMEMMNGTLERQQLKGKSYLYAIRNEALITLIENCKSVMNTLDIELNNRHLHIYISPIRIKENIFYVCLFNDISYIYENAKQRNEFTANVSHELKTPLTAIMGYAQLISEGMVSAEDMKRFSKKIDKEAQRMLNLINDIIELSFLDDKTITNKHTYSLNTLITNLTQRLEPLIREKNIQLTTYLLEDQIYGNQELLEELFMNVINNAIKYNKEQGSIQINSHKENNQLVVEVIDSGIGVSEQDCEHLFERFYRVDKSRSKETGGTGLGLAIVKHIVLSHGGNVRFESVLGEGSTLTILLPFENSF